MFQVSVQIQDYDREFARALGELERKLSGVPAGRLLFHVYSTVFSKKTLSALIAALGERFVGCQVVCCTVSGAVMDHDYRPGIVIAAKAFDLDSSRATVRMYELATGGDREVAGEIACFVRENPWVKAVELHRTRHSMNTAGLCEALTDLPQDITVFGGIVCSEDIMYSESYVADQSGKVTDCGLVAVYYGGDDLHIKTYRMSGWRPIDKYFTVTRAEENVIKEIDDAPAADIYKRYLDIEPDEHFVQNVLEFPFLSEDEDRSIVRNVFSFDQEGGLAVAYDVKNGTRLRLCYADADSVAEDIRCVSREVMQFTPDVVCVVSCITRSIIWQMKEYMPELQGFKSVAPCHGYLSHGELIREEGMLDHHNTILVAAAFREGGVKDVAYPEEDLSVSTTVPLAVRLSTFISRVTGELSDMCSEAEQVANTDALTQIGNRYRFDEVIRETYADIDHVDTKVLLMFDLNELKFVNDTYGHNDGDILIRTAAKTIEKAFSPYGQCFRIGGDEFSVIADFESEAELQKVLKGLHNRVLEYNKTSPYALSMAVGYAALIDPEGKMLSASEWRSTADINMYRDKAKFHGLKPNFASQSMVEFVACIMSLMDNKNPTFAYRPERVQRMAVAIAQLMGLDETTIEKLKLSAYMHDFGKIGLEEAVVSAVDPFSEEARKALYRLPAISRRLLKTSEELKIVASIVYASFERWDGTGFPEGLAGEDIPIEARIGSVAYFIDTAMHEGYGRPALSLEGCAGALAKNAGGMFDPAVVNAVLPHLAQIIEGDMAI